MKKVLFTYNYGEEKMKAVEALGYNVVYVDERMAIINDEIKDAEVLVCYNPFNTLEINKMTKLKWIQLSSIGIDQLPMDYVKKSGIMVTNNRGGYSIPMGEWVIMSMLELLKRSLKLYKNQTEKRWKMDTTLLELYGKKVGFIGTGSIAIESAKRLQGFETEVFGVNTSGRKVEYFTKCYSMNELDEMLKICDVVVVTIPSTDRTYHLLDEARFTRFKKGAYLINVARGNIIDEEALIRALKDGTLNGAALDVFEREPLIESSPLWDLENVIITPHNSWISEMRNDRRWEIIIKNLENYQKGSELMNVVDLGKGY